MKDEKIIELFFARNEDALRETELKYRNLCLYVSSNFLVSREDREETLNDSLLALWNSIPPERPANLGAYLSEIVRRLSINKSRANNAWKRGKNVQIVGEEFLSMIEDGTDLAAQFDAKRGGELISAFLRASSKSDRKVFIMRYWLDMSIEQISSQTGFGESKVKVTLHRMRKKLAAELGKEGITV
ncbi:MAG: sigma-70 family RNA polymerase sigma factor [Clostridia bacterium]|nr:sigma-70 family RNA polymerase sigma factor [Clostridia bacterium]